MRPIDPNGSIPQGALQSAAELIADLSRQGIRLWLEDGRLRCGAPKGFVGEDLRQRLQTQREGLIAVLGAHNGDCQQQDPSTVQTSRLGRDAPPTLTLAQEALLPLARVRCGESAYNVMLGIEVAGRLNPGILQVALNRMLARHDSLRTIFPEGTGVPVLIPRASGIAAEETATGLGEREAAEAIRKTIARPFNLSHGPLWRYCVFGLENGKTIVIFVFHHLVFDGFSRDVFLGDLADQFDALLTGTPVTEHLPAQTSDFAIWERNQSSGQLAESARAWWRGRFTTPCNSVVLPSGPPDHTARSHHVGIPARLSAALRGRAMAARLPAAALAITAALLALHQTTGQKRILAMMPVTNRDHPESFDIVGYLNRVLPLLVEFEPASSPGRVASELARELFGASAHRFLPTSEIVGLPGLARCQLNRLLISWQEAPDRGFRFGGLPARELLCGREGTDFGLALQFEVRGDRIVCRIDSSTGVLGQRGQAAFGERLVSLLDAITGDGWDRTIAEIAPPLIAADSVTQALVAHPGVNEAFALAESREGRFRVWIVLNEECAVSEAELQDWLREHLGYLMPPMRLTTRAALPRTAGGDIDADALCSTEDHGQPVKELPDSELERTIAQIWRKILWLDRPVGRNEDFRTLGGHSLLAVRMIGELEAVIGRSIAPGTIAHLSTVAAFAAAVENPDRIDRPVQCDLDSEIHARLMAYTASWSGQRPFVGAILVGRNTRGTRPALFWCLQNETELKQLAHHLGEDQPIFGMRSGHAVMVKSFENIDRLAKHYATEIVQTTPDGPVLIGGNCQAAVIAFHVARHLLANGRDVPLLILHEKMVPEPYAGRVALSFGRDSSRNPYVLADDPAAEFGRYYCGPFSIDLVSGTHGEFFKEPHVISLASMIRRRCDEIILPAASGGQD